MPPALPPTSHDGSIVDTLQSLIIAFVLAMTFRGFVTEGFVIPTGSMAPTLMGQHVLLHSDQSGVTFPVGLDQWMDRLRLKGGAADLYGAIQQRTVDPMLGPKFPGSGPHNPVVRSHMGDRILVLKCLYPFSEPERFDVVVFKNPTEPIGDAGNYIKRLIGLPNEQIWLADGDVFARPDGESEFVIQRKPEHVQRAVWQRIYDSDYPPINPQRLEGRAYDGPPWHGEKWQTTVRDDQNILRGTRAYRCEVAAPSTLEWRNELRQIDDWTVYNMLSTTPPPVPVSDIRVSAAIRADSDQFKTRLELQARSYIFEFVLENGKAIVRMKPQGPETEWVKAEEPIELPDPGKVFNVEFWHVDQSMSIFIDGERVVNLDHQYDWGPMQRMHLATGEPAGDVDAMLARIPPQPRLTWHFEGSPVTLTHVRLDRDLYYRADRLRDQKNQPRIHGPAFGTHPEENKAVLGPDQFMMCGDNSQMSLDSRLWGRPHPLIAQEIDPAPFVVNRELLLGKAWVVYFPSTFSIKDGGGLPVVPDFGRLRFIR